MRTSTKADRPLRQFGYMELHGLVTTESWGIPAGSRIVPRASEGGLTLLRPGLPDVRGHALGLHHCLEFAADLIVQQLREERMRLSGFPNGIDPHLTGG